MNCNFRFIVMIAICVTVFWGCAAPVKEQDRTGFISDYSRLEKASDTLYLYLGQRLRAIRSIALSGRRLCSTPKPDKLTNSPMKR